MSDDCDAQSQRSVNKRAGTATSLVPNLYIDIAIGEVLQTIDRLEAYIVGLPIRAFLHLAQNKAGVFREGRSSLHQET